MGYEPEPWRPASDLDIRAVSPPQGCQPFSGQWQTTRIYASNGVTMTIFSSANSRGEKGQGRIDSRLNYSARRVNTSVTTYSPREDGQIDRTNFPSHLILEVITLL